MKDIIVTGASRGIGRALALALSTQKDRLILVARDAALLASLVEEISRLGGNALAVPGDLSSLSLAKQLGERLVEVVQPGATLIQNAGLWPTKRTLTPEGLELSFVVNHLAPLVMQEKLIAAGKLRRVMVVSAGLLVKGRFDPVRTPTGEDFSAIRTYCNTKLCFALASRDVAAAHPEIDFVVLHPGVVRTDLGARPGFLGWLLSLVKRGWESPEVCAQRLVRILSKERWSSPGEARWFLEEKEMPWPENTQNKALQNTLRDSTASLLRTKS